MRDNLEGEAVNEEELREALDLAVKEGLLVQILSPDGFVAWIDSRCEENFPKNSVVLAGEFKREPK